MFITILAAFLFFSMARCSKYQFVWTVTNPSSHYVSFCVYNTPAEGIRNELFEVFQIAPEHKDIPYRGPICERAAPTANEHLILAPGESFRASVDIPHFYNMSEPGTYEINSNSFPSQSVESRKRRGTLDPESVLLSSKLELLRTPVELDNWQNFNRLRRLTLPFTHKGLLPFSKSLTVTITPNTTGIEWSHLTYNSEDDMIFGKEGEISERKRGFRGSGNEEREREL